MCHNMVTVCAVRQFSQVNMVNLKSFLKVVGVNVFCNTSSIIFYRRVPNLCINFNGC